jgi:hypothetical protein
MIFLSLLKPLGQKERLKCKLRQKVAENMDFYLIPVGADLVGSFCALSPITRYFRHVRQHSAVAFLNPPVSDHRFPCLVQLPDTLVGWRTERSIR